MDANGRQPDFDAEERAAVGQPRYTLARERARSVLKALQVNTPPVDVERIIVERGLKLTTVAIDSVLAGQIYPLKREIAINKLRRSRERQRFTMAHELGHWELAHHVTHGALPPDNEGFAGRFEDDGATEGKGVVEVEANVFAAELLMPAAWIRLIPKGLSPGQPDRLAAQYLVSREAMFYQLMKYGRL